MVTSHPPSSDAAPSAALAAGQQHTVSIETFAYTGAGLCRIGDQQIHVPHTVPGQRVNIVLTRRREGFMEGKVLQVLKKSVQEVMPRCQHFHDCGGCSMQNLSYDRQIGYKEGIVRDALLQCTPAPEAVRKELPGRVLKIIPSPQVFHYRNKLELSFGFETMRSAEQQGKRVYFDENPTIGFHQPGNWSTVLPITDCHLYDEQLAMLLNDIRRFMSETRLPVYNPKTHKGMLRLALLRRGVQTGQHMIAFMVQARKKELEPLFQTFLKAFSGRSGLASLLVIEHMGLNDKPEHPTVHCLVGKPFITERLFDLAFELSPFSFFQTNTLGAEKLYQAVAQAADLTGKDVVLDAYCGMGTIGQYLSRFCEKVVGIESSPSAIDDALRSASRNRIGNISFYKGRTEQVLSQQLKAGGKYRFSVIVLDPPRAGLHPRAREAVVQHQPYRIVYVSCNVVSFAQDLGYFLKHGYELRTVQPVDMFPHTSHVETVAVLQRSA